MKYNLLILSATLLLSHNLFAKEIKCFKKDWSKPSTIETTPLDGEICAGDFSLKQMQKKGWFIKDIDIQTSKNGLSYTYTLSDKNPVQISKKDVQKNIVSKQELTLNDTKIKITDVNKKTAKINLANLKIGQSGIIEHTYKNGKKMIVSSAYVSESNNEYSIITFIPFLGLKQNALPTSKRGVANGDTFTLNYLYKESLLISPSIESFRKARKDFPENNFVHSDVFGTYLKVNYEPEPNKQIIQDYAISQNMGTIFFVIENYVYIVDTKTFTILKKKPIVYLPGDLQMPFYTRVEKIESSFFSTDWFDLSFITDLFGDDDRTEEEMLYGDLATDKSKEPSKNYTLYYKKLLGLDKK